MKRNHTTYFAIVAFVLNIGVLTGCKKHVDEQTLGETVPVVVPPVGGNGGSNKCVATLAQAEALQIFPASNPWNLDIAAAKLDVNSVAIIKQLSGFKLKADFGQGLWDGKTIGIPYLVVCGEDSPVEVKWRKNAYDDNYGSESDPGPYQMPLNAPIEGEGKDGDSHVIVVDAGHKKLYELYNASLVGGKWEASCGAIFDLTTGTPRPDGFTSADAAGLPIFPGLVRYEEVLKGEIDHPIRFTLDKPYIQPGYVAPATHKVNSTGGISNTLKMGSRIRLQASFDVSGYSKENQVILKAMKKYGLILADIGSNFYLSGAPDQRWNNDDLAKLGQLKGSDFEVVNFH